jgi:hypothetical protein
MDDLVATGYALLIEEAARHPELNDAIEAEQQKGSQWCLRLSRKIKNKEETRP